eukprot:snap_masked-scaffold662_size116868-processed-gene-0.8 protein:Tk03148 transcript:snap_masked-scaffold662_size116868-processed-gene-0.8-mRNA-1 annotation:"conserved hypothetical protein"
MTEEYLISTCSVFRRRCELEECANRGGAATGSCALGYGVCCTFTVSCGQRSNENCTYFESTGVNAGACSVKICRCNSNICQLRLDFSNFVLTGPSTQTVSTGLQVGGVLSPAGVNPVSPATQCLTDSFSVTNPGGQSPPSICGVNSGEHTSQRPFNIRFLSDSFEMGGGVDTGEAAIPGKGFRLTATKTQVQVLRLCLSRDAVHIVNNLGLSHADKADHALVIEALKNTWKEASTPRWKDETFEGEGKIRANHSMTLSAPSETWRRHEASATPSASKHRSEIKLSKACPTPRQYKTSSKTNQ